MNLLNGYNYVPPSAVAPKKKRRWLAWTLVITIIIFCGIYGALAYAAWNIFTPRILKDATPALFSIAKGESLEHIASNLVSAGFIRRKEFFVYYAYFKGQGTRLQAGEYALRNDMNIPEILEVFVEGRVVPSEIELTIPEGFSVRDIDGLLVQRRLAKPGEFRLAAESWEGYLFPDTYRFKKDVSATTVRDVMLANFKKKFTIPMRKDAELLLQKKDLYMILAEDCKERGRLLDDRLPDDSVCAGNAIVIMASLIEKEVREPRDMKIVSGILWNRLILGMPLQVDATVVYAANKKSGELTLEDLRTDSPYNTYLHKGLPPASIANAGLEALLAAIHPEESDYLYYLSKPTGETVFSKTLEEHNAAKAKFLKQ